MDRLDLPNKPPVSLLWTSQQCRECKVGYFIKNTGHRSPSTHQRQRYFGQTAYGMAPGGGGIRPANSGTLQISDSVGMQQDSEVGIVERNDPLGAEGIGYLPLILDQVN